MDHKIASAGQTPPANVPSEAHRAATCCFDAVELKELNPENADIGHFTSDTNSRAEPISESRGDYESEEEFSNSPDSSITPRHSNENENENEEREGEENETHLQPIKTNDSRRRRGFNDQDVDTGLTKSSTVSSSGKGKVRVNLLTRKKSHVRIWGWEPPGRKYWDWGWELPAEMGRDGLALERTFLSYIHTSQSLAVMGVIIAQVFKLEHAPAPDPVFGYHILGTPLACLCMGLALAVALAGTFRFHREVRALGRGKVVTGGWELFLTGLGIGAIIITTCVLLIGVAIKKDVDGNP